MSRARPLVRGMAGTLATVVLLLTGCGTGGPRPVTYVIGPPLVATRSTEPLIGRPVVELKHVLVPDYLDGSDLMVRRSDNVVSPSLTGRWGERLSVGVTRALAQDLQQRLPGVVVTRTAPLDRPALQILAEIEAFEPRPDGSVVLVARWRLVDPARQTLLAGERVSLTEPSTGSSDAAMAVGMSRAIDDLAAPLAEAVRTALTRRRVGELIRPAFRLADACSAMGDRPGRASEAWIRCCDTKRPAGCR